MSYYSVVTFKDFLFDKFNNLTKKVLDQFYKDLNNNLPTFSIGTKGMVIWGMESTGFWYGSETEIAFFENNGTFHLLSADIGDNHYQIFKDLYNTSISSNNCPVKIAEPLEADTLLITNSEHISLSLNTSIYYIKFKMPIDGYGIPNVLQELKHVYLQENFDMINYFKSFVDQVAWIFSTLKSFNHPCPSGYYGLSHSISLNDRMIDDNDYIFYKFSKFSSSLNDSIDKQMLDTENGIEQVLTAIYKGDVNQINIASSECLNYARLKWLPLKI